MTLSALLPAQAELIADEVSPYIGVVAGLGSGKTRGAVYKAFALGAANPGVPGIFAEPTYAMIEKVAIETFLEVLEEWGFEEDIDYKLWKRPPQRLEVRLETGDFEIWFVSTDNPRRLVGVNVGWVIIDEADDHKEASVKALASRVRHPKANVRQVVSVGTPETLGGWFQEWHETQPREGTRLIRSKTTDNHFLPDGYIEDHLGHLNEVERERYIEGLFVASGGRVYTHYTVEENEQPCLSRGEGTQVMAADFGRGCMAWIMGRVLDEKMVHFHGEQILEGVSTIDATREACRWWQQFFLEEWGERLSPDEAAAQVDVYCDPAGSDRFKGSVSDVRILRDAGFNVYHRRNHPAIKDRVNSVQQLAFYNRLLVDPQRCPYLAKCMQQQGYNDQGMPEKSRPREGKKGLDHGTDAIGYLIEKIWPASPLTGNQYRY